MSINRLIAISIDPQLEAGALHAAESLRRCGFRTQLFLSLGQSDSALEQSILQNPAIDAVLDYSLSDLAAVQMGLIPRQNPDRLTSAALRGIPQVIVPGSLDHALLHRRDFELGGRRYFDLDETTRLVRTSTKDNDQLGKEIAFKASASSGKVCVVIPRGGFSKWDGDNQPASDPQANRVLLDSILLWKGPQVELVESHRHINDPHFAQIAVDQLLKMIVRR